MCTRTPGAPRTEPAWEQGSYRSLDLSWDPLQMALLIH